MYKPVLKNNPTRRSCPAACDFQAVQALLLPVQNPIFGLPHFPNSKCFGQNQAIFVISTSFSQQHQQSVFQSTTFRPGCPSHSQACNNKIKGVMRKEEAMVTQRELTLKQFCPFHNSLSSPATQKLAIGENCGNDCPSKNIIQKFLSC